MEIMALSLAELESSIEGVTFALSLELSLPTKKILYFKILQIRYLIPFGKRKDNLYQTSFMPQCHKIHIRFTYWLKRDKEPLLAHEMKYWLF